MMYSRSVTTEVAVREEIYRRVRIKVSLGEGSEVEENEEASEISGLRGVGQRL